MTKHSCLWQQSQRWRMESLQRCQSNDTTKLIKTNNPDNGDPYKLRHFIWLLRTNEVFSSFVICLRQSWRRYSRWLGLTSAAIDVQFICTYNYIRLSHCLYELSFVFPAKFIFIVSQLVYSWIARCLLAWVCHVIIIIIKIQFGIGFRHK